MGGGMLTSFPTPVLSIAADAVRDLEGRDALSGLWALFTKCKESLQDGRRLENISWRLWYRDMMRDDFKNRLYQENENEKEKQDQENLLSLQETHTPTDLYTSPTPSESESIPSTPPSVVQDANRSKDPTLRYPPSFISATTALPQDHDHTTSSPTFSSSSFNPTLDTTFRSISPADPAPYPALDSPPASLQLSKSKSKSDTVLSPGVPVEQFALSASSSSSGSKPPCGSADITPPYSRASSVQPRQRRRLSGLDARINCHTGSTAPAPICVGRIIYDMLPCSASKGTEGSSNWIKELQIGLRWAGPSSMTTTTTRTLTAVEYIPTPVMDSYSFLQPPALTPTMKAGSISTQPMNTGTPTHADNISPTTATIIPSTPSSTTPNLRYTFSHMAPPSPSLSDSYARAHPGEVEVSDAMHLEPGVGLGPSLSFSASSPSSPEVPGNAHIFGLSPNLQLPPRVVVVNPTPNLTPQPTPPASPLLTASTSTFASPSSVSASTSADTSKNHRDWLMLPPNHNPQDSWQQTQDRSRSEDVDAVPSINTIGGKATDSDSIFLSVLPPQLPAFNHQCAGEDQLLVSPVPFVQDLETFANTNSNRHSISSTTTTTSTTDSTFSAAAGTDTSATTALLDEEGEEEPWKMEEDDDRWINDITVGSPGGTLVLGGVDTHPMLESDVGGIGPSMRLGSLSTIHSMSVRKGDREGDSAVFSSDEDTDVEYEELRDERGEGPSTRLINPVTTTAATVTMKKKKLEIGTKTKTKTKAKTKPLKRNSLRSPTSILSPPPLTPSIPNQSSSSSTNQKQRTTAPPVPAVARRPSTGRSSSRSVSRSGRSCVGVSAEKGRTNSSVSRSRSRESRGVGGALLGMTAAARATSGERKKPVIAIFTKPKQRPKFTLGRSGAKAGGGPAMIRRESSAADPESSGLGAGVNSGENEKEGERERGREQMMEIIQMQRRQQLLIQQQQQEEMKQGMDDRQRTLAAQLARQDADVREAEIRRQRQRHLEQQQGGQEMQGGANGLLGVSSKRPVRFNIGSNSDEGSGVGSNSKSGSEISGIEGLVNPPVVHSIANGKGKERDTGIPEQETTQQEQHQLQGDLRQPEHHPQQQRQISKQELHQLKMMQQQHLHHQQRRQPHTVVPHPHPQQAIDHQLQQEETGKGRKHSNPSLNPHSPPAHNIRTKHSTHETLNMVSSALAAKVKHTLSDPLLPGQHKRTIVLTTSDSDFEDSDDGSWSSEEMGSEDEEERQKEEQQRQEQLLAQQHLQRQQQPQRQSQQQQQQPVPRTQSSNHLPSANHNPNHHHTHTTTRTQRNLSSRGHRHPPVHAHGHAPNNNQALMTQAAHEARRQREMFAKKPTESFQNLTVARTRSVGLLTQLMNPNPEIFPVGHPYRRGYSSSEIRGVGGSAGGDRGVRDREINPLLPLMDVKTTKADARDNKSRPPPSRPEGVHRKSSSTSTGGGALGHSRVMSALSPPARTLSMQLTKSTAALPVSSQVQVGSVSVNTSNGAEAGHGVVKDLGMTNRNMNVNTGHSSGGYRPKGPPQDQELEDESGSEPESGGGIQVSKSVAQEKLRALAQRRGIVTHGNQPTTTANAEGAAGNNLRKQVGDEDDVPQWAKVSQPRQPTRTRSQDQYQQTQAPSHNVNRHSLNGHYLGQLNVSALNHSTPIPVGHPYNLPPPAPPSTPRTTRRLMLSTELSESLRRNLLWERQLSKVNLAATMRRSASGGGSRHSILGGIQPLTSGPSMVQLHPKGTNRHPNLGSPARAKQEGSEGSGGDVKKERRASGGAITSAGPVVYDENEREQRKRLAMARNRSWANDYHYSGW